MTAVRKVIETIGEGKLVSKEDPVSELWSGRGLWERVPLPPLLNFPLPSVVSPMTPDSTANVVTDHSSAGLYSSPPPPPQSLLILLWMTQ